MRGDVIYRVYGLHDGRQEDTYFGAFRTTAEAEVLIAELLTREMHGRNWAEQYHSRGFVIREAIVETDFEIPRRPKPRDRYFVRGTATANKPGTWDSTIVEVFRRTDSAAEPEKVAEYERNCFNLLHTFEPFRQGDRELALISRHYTGTAVLDLETGGVIAEEPASPHGFCPVGFYVPDWWDVHDESIIPGSEFWNSDHEWPSGDFGFVWGCVWGDDSSWKVQYLDLSDVRNGAFRRDERFGYVQLATVRHANPTCEPEAAIPPQGSRPPPFIEVARWKGKTSVTFAVRTEFDLGSGQPVPPE